MTTSPVGVNGEFYTLERISEPYHSSLSPIQTKEQSDNRPKPKMSKATSFLDIVSFTLTVIWLQW